MTTKTKTPRQSNLTKAAAKGPTEAERKLIDWLKENDARLFCGSHNHLQPVTVETAFESARLVCGEFSRAFFDAAVTGNCRFFSQPVRLQRKSEATAFTSAEWDRLQELVIQWKHELARLNLRECETFCRIWAKTNAVQLVGLPSRFHVWTDAANPIMPAY